MLKEVRFRFRHNGCWMQDTTSAHPSVMMVATSIYMSGDDIVTNVTLHAPDAAAVDAVVADWHRDKTVRKVTRLHDGPNGSRFHVRYRNEGSIVRHIMEHTPVSIGAIRFAEGVEYYHLIGEAPEIQALIEELSDQGELEVQSIKDPEEFADASEKEATDGALWAGLTDKQLEAVVLAHVGGYYQWPRDQSASGLAESLGLSSSAFLDHLRHGEAKLLGAIIGQLQARDPGRVQSIRARHAVTLRRHA